MRSPSSDTRERAKLVRLLVLDCDGVLTDGRLFYGSSSHGDAESACYTLAFNAQDGNSMKMLMRSGVEIAVISGRDSTALRRRLHELGIKRAFLNKGRKGRVLDGLIQDLGIEPSNLASMGDDIPDLALFERSGLCLAPANAHPVVRSRAHHVTEADGGHGCVREAVHVIMTAQESFDSAVDELIRE